MELNETSTETVRVSAEERAEEQKLIRRLQFMMNMVIPYCPCPVSNQECEAVDKKRFNKTCLFFNGINNKN